MTRRQDKEAIKYLEYMRALPKPPLVKASDDCHRYLNETILPKLKDQVLSELRRNNGIAPRLIGFMDDGSLGIVDLSKALPVPWGDARTKDTTAFVHQLAARVPGVTASVFCSETWLLRGIEPGQKPRDISDHPDREEAVMFNTLFFQREANTMMQLMAMVLVIKVLGHNTSPKAWRDTQFGETAQTIDPGDHPDINVGRFVYDGREQ